MSNLPLNTLRRLKKIPQSPSVWEGDRRSLTALASESSSEEEGGDCILWVDGSEGMVRAMEIISPEIGVEAIARTLLRAIESPQSPGRPSRPKKIVVRDREIQFFLRGALQNLEIAIDYVPELPIIDELFRSFAEFQSARPPRLPPQYAKRLREASDELWKIAPWEYFEDCDILAIEVNHGDIETLYITLLGMLGQEYGVLFYRSLDSLKRFRASAIEKHSMEALESAFLSQDCLFLNYEADEDVDFDPEDEDDNLADLPLEDIVPIFGSLHPYEGLRPFLDEEEAIVVYASLKALVAFFEECSDRIEVEDRVPVLKKSYAIALPATDSPVKTLEIGITTLPDLTNELLSMGIGEEDGEDFPEIRDDLFPDKSFVSIGMLPWSTVELVRTNPRAYNQSLEFPEEGEGLPIILIQTSRPKAKDTIVRIQNEGGIEAISFTPGEDPLTDTEYDLGVVKTGGGVIYVFSEYSGDDPTHIRAKKNWTQRLKKTKGHCGLVLAMGVTGASRGKPKLKDMLALFETRAVDSEELGIGTLQMIPQIMGMDW
ncbi:MAG: hypothetical protein J7647_20730 [Cyanobacteria bacterium SBLK]|nr:hypothetical protein [Cyanobacteria bacterium SBLK]